MVYEIYPRSFQDSNGDSIGDLRGIKLVLDLVANHTSDEHPWFVQSRASRTNPYRDYYHRWPAEKDKPPYRRTFFSNDTEAWQYDAPTNSYYLHYYAAKQPDLNWENPKVRQEVYGLMRFWLDKGLDGFRMDVLPFISKDTTWPVLAAEQRTPLGTRAYYANGPHLHEYLREMNQQVLSKYDMLSVGEASGVGLAKALDFIAPDRHELDMIYDVPRMVSRWGNDRPPFRAAFAKLLTTFLLTMRGTPY